ncbi:hypothetical protein EMCRGX_G029431 [Ephydatia muelleri]
MWVATLLLAHHFILGADLGSMPSGPTLAQADIPVVNTQGDADQTQSAQSTMQPAVAHSIPDPRNEPAVSVGEGMAPVPRKLAEKIWKWEFVEMSEMVAENWLQKSDEPGTGLVAVNRRKRLVTELIPWVQCFATYTSVMSRRFPESVPELLAYMTGIIRASREHGPTWIEYDSAFRRQAASTGNRVWSRINPSLYAVNFTGKAQGIPRCSTCASIDHVVRDCPYSAKTDLERTLEAVLAACSTRPRASGEIATNPSQEICRRWNEMRCSYQYCRYRHACLGCVYQYTGDLLALERCRATWDTRRIPPPKWSRITTPLEWSEWEEALKSHPDQQYRAYIVTGLREGFRVGFDYAHHSCQSATRNMHSAREHAQYATVDQATESVVRLGRGTLMAKIDIKAAYRLVPVHPEDRWLLGMQFEGADFMDTVLPFGMRSAPKIFNAVADALEWVCRNEGVQEALHYLDDFMVFGAPDSSECSDYLLILRSVFWRLGVPIAEHKTAAPSSKITFLGVEIDSQQLTLRLPEEKLTELKALVSSWLYKKVAVHGGRSQKGTGKGRGGPLSLLRSQFQDRSSDYGSSMWSARLPDQDTGEVGECSVHGLHPNPSIPVAFSSGKTDCPPGRFGAVVM